MFKVELHPKVFRFLQKLPKETKTRIIAKLKMLKENPFHYLEHYEKDNYYKLRIGDYRALIDIDFKNKIIEVQVLDFRKRIYK